MLTATGIVKRMDDLGRVVIPQKVRDILNMPDGTPIEILYDTKMEAIVLRKYQPWEIDL